MDEALREPIKTEIDSSNRSQLLTPTIFIVFAIVCFITSLIMTGTSKMEVNEDVSVNDGIIGPIEVKKDNSVFELKGKHDLNYGENKYVTIELLDENKNYLFSFGKEFWAEKGYDGEYWYQKETKVESKFTIKEAGTYFIRLKSEGSTGSLSSINIKVARKYGSSLPHMIAGIIALLIGIVLYHLKAKPESVRSFYSSIGSAILVIAMMALMIISEL